MTFVLNHTGFQTTLSVANFWGPAILPVKGVDKLLHHDTMVVRADSIMCIWHGSHASFEAGCFAAKWEAAKSKAMVLVVLSRFREFLPQMEFKYPGVLSMSEQRTEREIGAAVALMLSVY